MVELVLCCIEGILCLSLCGLGRVSVSLCVVDNSLRLIDLCLGGFDSLLCSGSLIVRFGQIGVRVRACLSGCVEIWIVGRLIGHGRSDTKRQSACCGERGYGDITGGMFRGHWNGKSFLVGYIVCDGSHMGLIVFDFAESTQLRFGVSQDTVCVMIGSRFWESFRLGSF